jgi:hypothetical protein
MKRPLALVAACALAGCSLLGGGDGGEADPFEADRALSKELLEADRALSKQLLESGAAAAFGKFFDQHGIQFGPSGEPVIGLAQLRASAPQGVLSREPRRAEASDDGNWGWTWGDWQLHERGAGGRRLAQGRYLDVWRRQADGSWKVRADLGAADHAP